MYFFSILPFPFVAIGYILGGAIIHVDSHQER